MDYWHGVDVQHVLRPKEIQHNLVVRICLDKKDLQGSMAQNYKQLKIGIPVKFVTVCYPIFDK